MNDDEKFRWFYLGLKEAAHVFALTQNQHGRRKGFRAAAEFISDAKQIRDQFDVIKHRIVEIAE